MWPHLLQVDQLHLATCDICVGPGVDNDTRTSSSHKDCLPLIPPSSPKPKYTYDHHNYDNNYNFNHIHCSGIQPLAATPMKCHRGEPKDPTGTAEKTALAIQ